jgi:hypothetical protein
MDAISLARCQILANSLNRLKPGEPRGAVRPRPYEKSDVISFGSPVFGVIGGGNAD